MTKQIEQTLKGFKKHADAHHNNAVNAKLGGRKEDEKREKGMAKYYRRMYANTAKAHKE